MSIRSSLYLSMALAAASGLLCGFILVMYLDVLVQISVVVCGAYLTCELADRLGITLPNIERAATEAYESITTSFRALRYRFAV